MVGLGVGLGVITRYSGGGKCPGYLSLRLSSWELFTRKHVSRGHMSEE